ncbi:MAG: hypothetical protein IJS41_10030 [Clostridia bacterium]|nr:hypothetical protein [Clostridia bacterium]
MKVSTTATSTASLAVPYTCRCAFCGATIRGEEKITVEGHAFKGGYADATQGGIMKLSASLQASANVPFELEYAEKRLEHYRGIVESGKLKALLETGKKNKADWFQVDLDSVLGNYLLHGPNKTQAQANQDKTHMSAYPYNWKVFDKNTAVKCPACGKTQPWCESLDGEGVGLKAFALGFVVCFLGLIPLMAGVRLQGAQVALALLPIAAWIVVSIAIRISDNSVPYPLCSESMIVFFSEAKSWITVSGVVKSLQATMIFSLPFRVNVPSSVFCTGIPAISKI